MTTLDINVYNLEGKPTNKVALDSTILQPELNKGLLAVCVNAYQTNQRQWSASTKGRADVKCTTKKMYRQKGTGNARHGNAAAPIFVGGGVAFGPKPKFDMHIRINKKERQMVLAQYFSQMARDGAVELLERAPIKEIKTKPIANFVKSRFVDRYAASVAPEEVKHISKRILFIGQESDPDFRKSMANLAYPMHKSETVKKPEYKLVSNLHVYDLVKADFVVFDGKGAFDAFTGFLKSQPVREADVVAEAPVKAVAKKAAAPAKEVAKPVAKKAAAAKEAPAKAAAKKAAPKSPSKGV